MNLIKNLLELPFFTKWLLNVVSIHDTRTHKWTFLLNIQVHGLVLMKLYLFTTSFSKYKVLQP
jgi:hypothetical protein